MAMKPFDRDAKIKKKTLRSLYTITHPIDPPRKGAILSGKVIKPRGPLSSRFPSTPPPCIKCSKVGGSQMVKCKSCGGIFHLSCLGVLTLPPREWACPACSSSGPSSNDPSTSAAILTVPAVAVDVETSIAAVQPIPSASSLPEAGLLPAQPPEERPKIQATKEDEDSEVHRVCCVCGSIGDKEAIVICSVCLQHCQHTYCMKVMLDVPPDDPWICFQCEPSGSSQKSPGGARKKMRTYIIDSTAEEMEGLVPDREVSGAKLDPETVPNGTRVAAVPEGSTEVEAREGEKAAVEADVVHAEPESVAVPQAEIAETATAPDDKERSLKETPATVQLQFDLNLPPSIDEEEFNGGVKLIPSKSSVISTSKGGSEEDFVDVEDV